MSRTDRPPTTDHEWLLLLAAFGDDDVSGNAWRLLAPDLDIDSIAHDAHGVFPQLGEALRRKGLRPHILARLEGVQKRLWARNSLRVREVVAARGHLAGHGVQSEVAGGLALLLRQSDLGRRPLVDAELVVDKSQVTAARSLLHAQGWTDIEQRRDGWLLDLHAATFSREGHALTLRWADGTWPYPSADAEHRRVVSVGNEVSLPRPAPLLAYTLIEGYRLWGYTTLRRYADAIMLLRDAEPVRWPDLLDLASERNATIAVLQTLQTIAEDLPGLVPSWVLDALREQQGGSYAWWTLAAERSSGTAAVFLRRTQRMSPVGAISVAPSFLREVWEVERARDLPVVGVRRLAARFARTEKVTPPSR
jgi:hypothetical protein